MGHKFGRKGVELSFLELFGPHGTGVVVDRFGGCRSLRVSLNRSEERKGIRTRIARRRESWLKVARSRDKEILRETFDVFRKQARGLASARQTGQTHIERGRSFLPLVMM